MVRPDRTGKTRRKRCDRHLSTPVLHIRFAAAPEAPVILPLESVAGSFSGQIRSFRENRCSAGKPQNRSFTIRTRRRQRSSRSPSGGNHEQIAPSRFWHACSSCRSPTCLNFQTETRMMKHAINHSVKPGDVPAQMLPGPYQQNRLYRSPCPRCHGSWLTFHMNYRLTHAGCPPADKGYSHANDQ